MLIRPLSLALALVSQSLAVAEAPTCAEVMRHVRDALAGDQNLAEDARAIVEQLLHDAAQAQKAGETEICREMMEDAKELLGLDSED